MPAEWEPGDDEEPVDEPRPGDTDYELSEEYGWDWEPRGQAWPVPPWAMVTLSILVVIALLVPSLVIIARW